MELTETIERTFADVADTLEATFGSLAERTPAPADKLLSQLGTFNVEAVRQCGRATVRSMAAMEEIVRTLEDRARGVAGKADGLRETVVDRARDEVQSVAGTAKKAAGEARTTAKKAAGRAKDAVEDVVDDAADAGVRAAVAATDLKAKTKAELYDLAQTADIEGRSGMTKAQLIAALKKI